MPVLPDPVPCWTLPYADSQGYPEYSQGFPEYSQGVLRVLTACLSYPTLCRVGAYPYAVAGMLQRCGHSMLNALPCACAHGLRWVRHAVSHALRQEHLATHRAARYDAADRGAPRRRVALGSALRCRVHSRSARSVGPCRRHRPFRHSPALVMLPRRPDGAASLCRSGSSARLPRLPRLTGGRKAGTPRAIRSTLPSARGPCCAG
jgi:hypothetical protein